MPTKCTIPEPKLSTSVETGRRDKALGFELPLSPSLCGVFLPTPACRQAGPTPAAPSSIIA